MRLLIRLIFLLHLLCLCLTYLCRISRLNSCCSPYQEFHHQLLHVRHMALRTHYLVDSVLRLHLHATWRHLLHLEPLVWLGSPPCRPQYRHHLPWNPRPMLRRATMCLLLTASLRIRCQILCQVNSPRVCSLLRIWCPIHCMPRVPPLPVRVNLLRISSLDLLQLLRIILSPMFQLLHRLGFNMASTSPNNIWMAQSVMRLQQLLESPIICRRHSLPRNGS
jgi:hypothetical protein